MAGFAALPRTDCLDWGRVAVIVALLGRGYGECWLAGGRVAVVAALLGGRL